MTRVMQMLALAAGLGACGALCSQAAAQQTGQPSKKAVQKAKATSKAAKAQSADDEGGGEKSFDAEAALDKARKAIAEGKAEAAAGLADQVLGSAGKTPRTTARALAIRGQARLKLGKPAEAMSDLDNAMWVKDGLGGPEREAATAARAEAYRQAGIGAPAPIPAAPSHQTPVQRVAVPSTPAVALPPPEVKRAPAEARAAAPVAPRPAPISAFTTTATPAKAPEAPRTAAVEPSPSPSNSGGIGTFFSNLFGGASSSAGNGSTTAAPETTGALPSARPAAVSASEPQRAAVASPQRSATKPQAAKEAVEPSAAVVSRTAVAAAPAGATVARQVLPTEGYQVQLAAVRTRDAAQAMADQVRSEHGDAVKGRVFEIDEPVFGNMGKFYRVRIGPFASATESLAICSSLRNGGLDCMVLGQQQ